MAEYLLHEGQSTTLDVKEWQQEWGISDQSEHRSGLVPEGPKTRAPNRQITLLQRKSEAIGKRLGKTTGWIHRMALKRGGVGFISGVSYDRIDADGLCVVDSKTAEQKSKRIAADTVILCAGQHSDRRLAEMLTAAGRRYHVIGGADVAAELDAKRAIDQGTRLAATL